MSKSLNFDGWFPLRGYERIELRCATEDCGQQVTWRLEAGGVGSNYCSACKERIDTLTRLEASEPEQ